jgi:hypothetical protein
MSGAHEAGSDDSLTSRTQDQNSDDQPYEDYEHGVFDQGQPEEVDEDGQSVFDQDKPEDLNRPGQGAFDQGHAEQPGNPGEGVYDQGQEERHPHDGNRAP